MNDIKNIIDSIDISNMETEYVDFYDMCDKEFKIYEDVSQPIDRKLTYCYYHSWHCTDTEVGIRVWYFENKPVCISYKPYRKSSEVYGWISKMDFDIVRNYAMSLVTPQYNINIIDDNTISDIITKFAEINYKKFEKLNVIIPS